METTERNRKQEDVEKKRKRESQKVRRENRERRANVNVEQTVKKRETQSEIYSK